MSACSVSNCARPLAAKGYCHLHYNRWRRHGAPETAHRMCPRDASVSERLALVLDRSGGPNACWPFTGAVNRTGYGRMRIAGTTKAVHVWAYEDANGPVPDGLIVRHSCDNRPCGNPAHLLVGTNQDNMDDKVARDRQFRPRGELSPMAILTTSQVVEMRRRRLCDGVSLHDLAESFGVRPKTVDAIVAGRRWAHLPITVGAEAVAS